MTKVRNIASRRPGGSRELSNRTERPVTVRLDDQRLALLTGLAIVDETTVAEQIRQASLLYVESRLSDPALEARAHRAVARFQAQFVPLLEARSRRRAGESDEQGVEIEEQAPQRPERDAASEKSVTFRLDSTNVDYFTGLALLDDWTLADELRAAVDTYVTARREDPELVDRIEEAGAEQAELLARLQPAG